MKFDQNEYTIATYYLPSLINGDDTGLDETEQAQFNEWLDSVYIPANHWGYEIKADQLITGIATCEITGLLAECATVYQFFPHKGD